MTLHPESTDARAIRDYSDRLRLTDRVFQQVFGEILDWIVPGPTAMVADVGCGAGGMTALLAQRLGRSGSLLALDVSSAHLEAARQTLAEAAPSDQVSLKVGSVDALPLQDASLDLVWCSHVVHGQPDPLGSLRELRRVLRPGGRIALREDLFLHHWLPTAGLGTRAGLGLRLAALEVEELARWREGLPGAVSEVWGWPERLRQAGFDRVQARTFTLDLLAPLTPDQENFLAGRLEAWRTDSETLALLTETDRAALLRLSDPDAQDSLLRQPGLHVVEGVTVYLARAVMEDDRKASG